MTGRVVLTHHQAAELAGCTPDDIARLVADDVIPTVDLGSTTVIPTRAFIDWLTEQALIPWRLRNQLAAAGVHLGRGGTR